MHWNLLSWRPMTRSCDSRRSCTEAGLSFVSVGGSLAGWFIILFLFIFFIFFILFWSQFLTPFAGPTRVYGRQFFLNPLLFGQLGFIGASLGFIPLFLWYFDRDLLIALCLFVLGWPDFPRVVKGLWMSRLGALCFLYHRIGSYIPALGSGIQAFLWTQMTNAPPFSWAAFLLQRVLVATLRQVSWYTSDFAELGG